MTRLLSVVAVALALSACATRVENPSDTLQRISDHAAQRDTAYRITESLTQVGPRLAGSENDQRARDWAVAKFKALGFDSVRAEPVSYPVWERGPARLQIGALDLPILALGGSMGTSDAGVRAPIIELASYEDLVAAPAEAVQGKIVFINRQMTRARDGSGYGGAVVARVRGASAAAQHGALAVIIRSIGTDTTAGSTPHTGIMRYEDTPTQIPAVALSTTNADRLSALLKQGEQSAFLQVAARTRNDTYTGANIVAEIIGSERPDEIVLLGGHLDSWDVGTGAQDDAAGLGITMGAAAMLLEMGIKPRRTIRVVAFANEEQGVYGGNAYGAAYAASASKHVLAAEADFGAGRVYRFSTRYLADEPEAIKPLLDALAAIGVEPGNPKGNGGADLGAIGKAGANLADLSQDGTYYFDIHHTANDTFDKIKPADIQQAAQAYALVTWFFSDERRVALPAPSVNAAQ